SQPAIGRHEPVVVEPGGGTGDPVVRARSRHRLAAPASLGTGAVEDQHHPAAVALRPSGAQLDQSSLGDVRPHGAANVLRVDEDDDLRGVGHARWEMVHYIALNGACLTRPTALARTR